MTVECSVCTESVELIGIGRCGHSTICALCHYKLRALQNNIKCGMCNANNEMIVITDDPSQDFEHFDIDKCIEFNKGELYFPSENLMQRFEKLTSTKCPFPECADTHKTFTEVIQYKKHLRERHKKYLW